MGAWKRAEEDLLREYYPEYGPSWDGWAEVLPNRTKGAISSRATFIGIKVSHEARSRMARDVKARRFDSDEFTIVDRFVRAAMERGKTPQEIDRAMHWWPGTTKRVLMHQWERDVA